MRIGGLQKTSLIDYPGKVACTVFVAGCNFRCPFCHNKELIEGDWQEIDEVKFFEFLEKRKGVLDGVCVTGGEPCLQKDLVSFCKKIKKLGLKIKLDTNGSRLEVIRELMKKGLVDMVAMDVKSRWQDYEKVAGVSVDLGVVKESIKLIIDSGLEYELRTTVVPGLHDKKILVELARQLEELGGKKVVWVLQRFRASEGCLKKKYRQMESFNDEEMKGFLKAVKEVLSKVRLRGL